MSKIKCIVVAIAITVCLIALYLTPAAEANGMPVVQKEVKVVEETKLEPIRPVRVLPPIKPVPIIFEESEEDLDGDREEDIVGQEYSGSGADVEGDRSVVGEYQPDDNGVDDPEEQPIEYEDESEGYAEYVECVEDVEEEPEPEPEEYVEPEPEPEPESNLEYIGDWTITAYCSCVECCGSWGNATASGATPYSGHTVACNTLPMGTQVMIDDVIYTVEDTGWTPYGDAWIDIYFDTHEEALAYGMHTTSVYIVH